MLYLSRMILDPRSRPVQRDLGDCHQLHRTVLRAFPQAPEGAQARDYFGLLYRVEPLDTGLALIRLLVQSNTAPDWSHLRAGDFGPAPDARGNPAVRGVSDEYGQIGAGLHMAFRLRANPTKRLSDRTPGRENKLLGKRVALLREEEQLSWLARQGERHGFRLLSSAANPELPDARAAAQETVRGRRPGRDELTPMPLRFGAVLFQGRLEVTNPVAFQSVLAEGIGPGKAFGFGLLSVAALG